MRFYLTIVTAVSLLAGCREENSVVVYAALDREFSGPVLQEFENSTGITVLAKYDDESTKTTQRPPLSGSRCRQAGRAGIGVTWSALGG